MKLCHFSKASGSILVNVGGISAKDIENTLLIQTEHVRAPMFCTLGCMSSFEKDRSSQNMRA
jgi:hypothetical protein